MIQRQQLSRLICQYDKNKNKTKKNNKQQEASVALLSLASIPAVVPVPVLVQSCPHTYREGEGGGLQAARTRVGNSVLSFITQELFQ